MKIFDPVNMLSCLRQRHESGLLNQTRWIHVQLGSLLDHKMTVFSCLRRRKRGSGLFPFFVAEWEQAGSLHLLTRIQLGSLLLYCLIMKSPCSVVWGGEDVDPACSHSSLQRSVRQTQYRRFYQCYCILVFLRCSIPLMHYFYHAVFLSCSISIMQCFYITHRSSIIFSVTMCLCLAWKKIIYFWMFYSMIQMKWNKVNSYISALKPLPRLPDCNFGTFWYLRHLGPSGLLKNVSTFIRAPWKLVEIE